MRIFVEDRTISPNVTGLQILFDADGSDTAGGETSSTGANQLGGSADELALGPSSGQLELILE